MDTIEFLKRTDQRNLLYNVGYLVKLRLKERDDDLECRREMLREILEYENAQYDQELDLLWRERDEECTRKRLEWLAKTEEQFARENEELLRLKAIQREQENSEEWRNLQSKQMLLEAKQGQLHQIEEGKAQRQRQREIEASWLEAWRRLGDAQEEQNVYGQKLQKIIARLHQTDNSKQEEMQKSNDKTTRQSAAQEQAEENERALRVDEQYRKFERDREKRKKTQQAKVLQQQIYENASMVKMQRNCERAADVEAHKREDQAVINELNAKLGARIRNREWQKANLENVLEEKKQMRMQELAYDAMRTNTGCLVEQQRKQPYGKNVR